VKSAIAASVAAQLSGDSNLAVTRKEGSFGELRISVDGEDVVASNPLWYPRPSSVVAKVKAYLDSARLS